MSINRTSNINRRLVGTVSTTTGSPGNAGQIGPIKTPYVVVGTLASATLGQQCFGGGSCGGVFKTKESNCGRKVFCNVTHVNFGGRLICRAGGVQWVVAPSSSQVTRTWSQRNDSNTRAQQVSGCTGWFVPSLGQLQNPGYTCRTYWDNCSGSYWSCDPINICAFFLSEYPGGQHRYTLQTALLNVRSFRCVTY